MNLGHRSFEITKQSLRALACFTLFGTIALCQTPSETGSSVARSTIDVTHILGFEGARHNANGELGIQGDALQFQRAGSPAVRVSIRSIQNIFLGDEDGQVGGVPMMLTKTAVPFGGGRVVSLFAHKKYDSLTLEYLDDNGSLHRAVFRLNKGHGPALQTDLVAKGAHVGPPLFVPTVPAEFTSPDTSRNPHQWSVQVDSVDPGAAPLEPSFQAAIYENFLEELAKTKQFKSVFRSGDRNANEVSDLLLLKTKVQRYTPGSETRRAVTTVAGATKLNVTIQLVTRDGRVVLEHVVEGDVRFIGNNLRATHNLAHNAANTLKHSTIPSAAGDE